MRFNLNQFVYQRKPKDGNITMTKAMHGVYLAIIAVLAYILWSQPEPNAVDTSATQVTKQIVVEKEIRADGKEEIEVIATTANDTPKTNSDTGEAKQVRETEVDQPRVTKAERDVEIEKLLREAIDIDEVQQRIHTESIDQDWAYNMQDSIVRLYDDNEALQSATLSGVECRTTVCRVEFTGTDTPIDHMQKFHQEMVSSPWFDTTYQSVMISNSKDKKHAVYIVRPK
ncbi:MAG: hypothetical protein COA51_05885 [Idiomarina sp.]|nr:MAG: hypothetical protein COA51_05885 [Idiomarina sp.]